MNFVSKVNIKMFQLGTCLDFAECFISMITNEKRGYNKVMINFDRYGPKSLNSKAQAVCSKRLLSVQCNICHTTKIEHLENKNFISSIETKSDLIEYLSKKLKQNLTMSFVVVYGNRTLSNVHHLVKTFYVTVMRRQTLG